jgi:hypothetical protein
MNELMYIDEIEIDHIFVPFLNCLFIKKTIPLTIGNENGRETLL